MGVFIVALAVTVGAINMAFQQGQDNPDAGSFFSSKAQTVQPYHWLGDE